MRFLSKLFGKRSASVKTVEQALVFIHEMEQLALQDPKNAMKRINRQRKSEVFQGFKGGDGYRRNGRQMVGTAVSTEIIDYHGSPSLGPGN